MSYWDDKETVAEDCRETNPAWIEYGEKLLNVLKAAKTPLTIAEIHKALGADADRGKTLDMLDFMNYVLRIPGFLDRYAYVPEVAKAVPGDFRMQLTPRSKKAWNGRAYV